MTKVAIRLAIVAAVVALCAFVAAASAATLGGVNPAQLYAAEVDVTRCTTSITFAATGPTFTTVRASSYPATCAGQTVAVTIHGAGVVANGTATLAAGSTIVALSTTVTAAPGMTARAIVGGLGVTTTLTITNPPTVSTTWFLRNTLAGGATVTQGTMPIVTTTSPLANVALPNYSTDAHVAAGRLLNVTGINTAATWTSSTATGTSTFNGSSTMRLDVQRFGGGGGRATLTATLRVVDAGGAVVTTLGSGTTQTASANPGANGANEVLTFAIPTVGSVTDGQRLEIVVTTAGRPVRLRYDTTTYPGQLTLPSPLTAAA